MAEPMPRTSLPPSDASAAATLPQPKSLGSGSDAATAGVIDKAASPLLPPFMPSTTSSASEATPDVTAEGSSRRRNKVHTSNACSNCKRAHLGCDSQRPCKRCIVGSKQDSCVDVPQKKRGRPRLRSNAVCSPALPTAAIHPETPIGLPPLAQFNITDNATRITMGLPPYTSVATVRANEVRARPPPPQPISQQLHAAMHGLRNTGVLSFGATATPLAAQSSEQWVTPTLCMDLDLNLLKGNESFVRIHGTVEGRRLHDMASPLQPEDFQNLRNRMRDEREAKDPFYMPPIAAPGDDFLGPLSSIDFDKATAGFVPVHYRFLFVMPNGVMQKLSAAFTLARTTSRYFIHMTLPPLTTQHYEIIAHHANVARTSPQGGSSAAPVGPLGFASLFSDNRVSGALGSSDDMDDLDDYGPLSATAEEQKTIPTIQTSIKPHTVNRTASSPVSAHAQLRIIPSPSTSVSTSTRDIVSAPSSATDVVSPLFRALPKDFPSDAAFSRIAPAWKPGAASAAALARTNSLVQEQWPRKADKEVDKETDSHGDKRRRMDIGSILQ